MDIKKAYYLKQLEKSKGIVLTAAEKSKGKFNRSSHYKWLKEDAEYATAVEELNTVALDFAEDKLFQLIDGGDTTATIFFLKCKGRKRGYIERPIEDEQPPVIIAVNVSKEEAKEIAAGIKGDI